jgi:OOP family OmpA-OmpF porin
MKKIVMFLMALTMLSIATAGYAQVKAGSITVSPTLGGYIFEGNEDTSNSLGIGLRAGYNFTRYLGLEGFVHYIPTEIVGPGGKEKSNFLGYGIEGLFHILPNGPLVPFLAVGVGGTHYSSKYVDTTEDKANKIAVDYGVGVKYFLTENFALRADVRHVIPFSDMHHNLLYSVGLTFAFGGAKKAAVSEGSVVQQAAAPAAVIMDSDKDGVPDDQDKCPGTPAGVSVDRDGCPLDSDRDGVPDYLDRCPDTPAGVSVDREGCPLDADKDGVPDYLDKCPGTLIGVSVDKDGCPPPVVQEIKRQAEKAPEILQKGRTTLNVLFATNKSVIQKNSFQDIDNLVAVMKQYPDLNVTIEGHTDNVGSAAYNKKLSQQRANAVKKYMVTKGGIDAKRLNAVGFGLEKPIATNGTKEGRAKNRRVEAATVDYIIKK